MYSFNLAVTEEIERCFSQYRGDDNAVEANLVVLEGNLHYLLTQNRGINARRLLIAHRIFATDLEELFEEAALNDECTYSAPDVKKHEKTDQRAECDVEINADRGKDSAENLASDQGKDTQKSDNSVPDRNVYKHSYRGNALVFGNLCALSGIGEPIKTGKEIGNEQITKRYEERPNVENNEVPKGEHCNKN